MRLVFRFLILIFVVIAIVVIIVIKAANRTEFALWQMKDILEREKYLSVGGAYSLTAKEYRVNKLILHQKRSELMRGHQNLSDFLPSQHFFHAKIRIKESKVYSIIRMMPKGASLHTHFPTAASIDYIMENITYRENLYGCFINENFILRFLQNALQDSRCHWKELKEYRKEDPNFDKWLNSKLSLLVDNPTEKYTNNDLAWDYFQKIFVTLDGALCYRPVFEDYVHQVLKELHDDNIMYTELRANINPLYELNGTVHGTRKFFDIFTKAVDQFKSKYMNFIGVRFIYSLSRTVTVNNFRKGLSEIVRVRDFYPNFIAGFDIVGNEEHGKRIEEYKRYLLDLNSTFKFFFHAGETSWYGATDLNLVEVILLNSSRVGHGFALTKHPVLMNMVKAKNIAIELCPISNQVLMLNQDPRNHPGASLIANGFPVVVGNDDPSAWGATGLSYDWYIVFMAMTSESSGIEVLKQFAMDSIKYSAMPSEEKSRALKIWRLDWETFLDEMLILLEKKIEIEDENRVKFYFLD